MNKLKWTVGDIEIFSIVEIQAGEIIQSVLEEAKPVVIREMKWLRPHFADKNGKLKAVVQSFLIKSNGKNILVDTCNGNGKKRTDIPEWGNLKTDYLDKLKHTGVSENEVDYVVCTHLHFDHVGWNTTLKNNKWVPTFSNSKYLFIKEEYDYWIQKPEKEIEDDLRGIDDSVIPIVKAGLVEFVDSNFEVDNNVRLVPTPGHTPGHVSIEVTSKGQKAIIAGDLIYHPSQVTYQNWVAASDTDTQKATISRKKMLKKITNTDTLLLGSHFSEPVVGKVVREDGSLIFEIDINE